MTPMRIDVRSRLPRILMLVGVLLVALCLVWELWLAPLRPGGSWLVLKAVPLALALPGLAQGRMRVYRWWSMLILFYVCEGAVRFVSDRGMGVWLAGAELLLAGIAFAGILRYTRPVSVKAA